MLRHRGAALGATLALAISAGTAQAENMELFFARGWLDYCKPAMERIASKREQAKDGEINASCVGYTVGIMDAAFLLLIHQKKPCAPGRSDREAVLNRTTKALEKTPASELERLPMVTAINRAVVAQCHAAE
jgi:hypothetical protein